MPHHYVAFCASPRCGPRQRASHRRPARCSGGVHAPAAPRVPVPPADALRSVGEDGRRERFSFALASALATCTEWQQQQLCSQVCEGPTFPPGQPLTGVWPGTTSSRRCTLRRCRRPLLARRSRRLSRPHTTACVHQLACLDSSTRCTIRPSTHSPTQTPAEHRGAAARGTARAARAERAPGCPAAARLRVMLVGFGVPAPDFPVKSPKHNTTVFPLFACILPQQHLPSPPHPTRPRSCAVPCSRLPCRPTHARLYHAPACAACPPAFCCATPCLCFVPASLYLLCPCG